MKRGIIITLIFVFMLISIVHAQPPLQTGGFAEGYSIKYPINQYVQTNQTTLFNFHVFNISDGVPVDNSSTSCYFHLYDSTGHNAYETIVDHVESNIVNEWELELLGANFSTSGLYSYIIQCNSSVLGGFDNVQLEVNQAGRELNTGNSILYFTIFFASLFIFILTLWIAIILPFKNRNEAGEMIGIERAKYVKILFLYLSYMFFTWLVNLLHVLSNNFGTLNQFTEFFRIVFGILISTALPLFVVMFIVMLILAWRDLKLRKMIERGFTGY